jgi:hypothetical protein
VGSTFQVLAQGWDKSSKGLIQGLSDNYLPVLFPFPREIRNEVITVRIDKVEGSTVHGSQHRKEVMSHED